MELDLMPNGKHRDEVPPKILCLWRSGDGDRRESHGVVELLQAADVVAWDVGGVQLVEVSGGGEAFLSLHPCVTCA